MGEQAGSLAIMFEKLNPVVSESFKSLFECVLYFLSILTENLVVLTGWQKLYFHAYVKNKTRTEQGKICY